MNPLYREGRGAERDAAVEEGVRLPAAKGEAGVPGR